MSNSGLVVPELPSPPSSSGVLSRPPILELRKRRLPELSSLLEDENAISAWTTGKTPNARTQNPTLNCIAANNAEVGLRLNDEEKVLQSVNSL